MGRTRRPHGATAGAAGFGSRIVETALPNELGGLVALDYRADGLRCSIRSPLAALDKVDAFMPLE